MISIYDLAYGYIKINEFEVTQQEKVIIINTITEVLNDGASSEDIIRKIKSCKNSNREHSGYFKSIKPSGNLLKHSLVSNENKIFYHNELRIVPDAPLVHFDIDSGDMITEKRDYFLEMRASYTVDDLYKYVKKKEFLARAMEDESRAKGSLKFLLGKYEVDFLLFMIDTSNEMYSTKLRYCRNVLDTTEYEEEARENYERRVTECAISDSNKIVYKKREL